MHNLFFFLHILRRFDFYFYVFKKYLQEIIFFLQIYIDKTNKICIIKSNTNY